MRLGVDVGGTKIEGIALDGSAEAARVRVDTPREDYEATLQAIANVVRELEQRCGERGSIGVGIPGTLSPVTGFVKNANSVWLIGRPLLADLQRLLDREVRIANDANCFAISEATDGAATGSTVVFGVIVGTGVGAGIVVNGTLLVGPNAIAGEWGHNQLPWLDGGELPGPRCYCGLCGCIETFLCGPALQADYERFSGTSRTAREIVAAAAAGDVDADAALDRYETRMARALAGVINVLDPDVIVLGGGMSNIARLYERVPRLWEPYIFACGAAGDSARSDAAAIGRDPVATRLVRALHGDSSGVRGAAWLWPATPEPHA